MVFLELEPTRIINFFDF